MATLLTATYVVPSARALAGTSGGIAGYVTDSRSGQRVPYAQVEARSASQVANTTADARGHFNFFALQPDDYTITIDKEGYNTSTSSGYEVEADQTQQYDLQISPTMPTHYRTAAVPSSAIEI